MNGDDAFHTLEVAHDVDKHTKVEGGRVGNLDETHGEDFLVEEKLADEVLGEATHEDHILVDFALAFRHFRLEVGDFNVDAIASEEM